MTKAKLRVMTALFVVLSLFPAGAGWTAQHFLVPNRAQLETVASEQPEKPTTEKTERTDRYGDPLPPGALLRMGTVRFRSRASIGCIAYSPDGKILAAGDHGGDLVLYDAATGSISRKKAQRPISPFPPTARHWPAPAAAIRFGWWKSPAARICTRSPSLCRRATRLWP
ncbi:MAG: hypothetical protein ACYC3I_09645 [Gemmataceae bacterium]